MTIPSGRGLVHIESHDITRQLLPYLDFPWSTGWSCLSLIMLRDLYASFESLDMLKGTSCGYHIMKTCLFKYILKISPPKTKFSDKNSNIFLISAPNIDCGYSLELPHRGSSNEYPQSMFLSRNKKNNVYPCKPQFYWSKLYRYVFVISSLSIKQHAACGF